MHFVRFISIQFYLTFSHFTTQYKGPQQSCTCAPRDLVSSEPGHLAIHLLSQSSYTHAEQRGPVWLHWWPPPQTHHSRLLSASCSAVCSRVRGKTVTWAVYFCWESFQGLYQMPFVNAIKQCQSNSLSHTLTGPFKRAPTDFRFMIPLCENRAVFSPVHHVSSCALNSFLRNNFYSVAWHRHQACW